MTKLTDDKQFVSFAIPKATVAELEALAKELGQTRSAFIRDCVQVGMDRVETHLAKHGRAAQKKEA